MPLVLAGATSGSITIDVPAAAGTNTLTVPALTGTVITTASTGQNIPKAALPTGSVLQVVQTQNTTTFSSSSTSFVTPTGMSATITPTSASSKILVIGRISCSGSITNIITLYSQLIRDSTALDGSTPATSASADVAFVAERFINYLDSPATTSATTYSIQFRGDGATWRVNLNGAGGNSSLSTITLMEIAA